MIETYEYGEGLVPCDSEGSLGYVGVEGLEEGGVELGAEGDGVLVREEGVE